MNQTEEDSPVQSGATGAQGGEKPYQKPQFRFEHVFETRALTCGKVSPNQSSCAHSRQNS